MFSNRIGIVLFFGMLTAPVFGQLKWENPDQTLSANPQDKVLAIKFRFTNVGSSIVRISDVRPSCGCTTASLSKTQYAPGESGEIEAKFKVEGRSGHQEKWVTVTTDWVPPQPIYLHFAVNISEPISIQPELVLWRVGDRLEAKTVRITVPDNVPAKVISVQTDNAAVKLELHEIRPGKELEIKVTPPTTSQPCGAKLIVKTDYPPQSPTTLYAYVRVK
jgi:Protein of unknown function (DUF1573)